MSDEIVKEPASGSGSSETPPEIKAMQKELDTINKGNEILNAELTRLQKQADILKTYLPSGQTAARTGEVTADDSSRFLTELVANQGIQSACRSIVDQIEAANLPGGILMVDDLDLACGDAHYLQIKKKTRTLQKIAQSLKARCEEFIPTSVPKEQPKVEREGQTKAWMALATERSFLTAPSLTAIATIAGAMPGALAAVGDIVSHFRSDYVFKSQTPQNIDDFYAQTVVAGLLNKNNPIYWHKFHLLEESPLLANLKGLLQAHQEMLACVEGLKVHWVDPKEAKIQALTAHLSALRTKLVDYLVKEDGHTIERLKTEIAEVTQQLKACHQHRTLDTQISALETHLASLRAKLVDELVKSGAQAVAAVKKEVDTITAQLAANDAAAENNKLAASQVAALKDQLKLLQNRYTDLLVSTNNNVRPVLEAEIIKTYDQLQVIKEQRLPDSQITSLETHLAALQSQLVTFLVNYDTRARATLEAEIQSVEAQIEAARIDLPAAKEIVTGATKASETITAFLTQITSAPAGGGQLPLVEACLYEALHSEKITYLLKIKLVSSGGDFLVQKQPFWSSKVPTAYYAGGVVSYLLVEKSGKVVASGTVANAAALDHTLGQKPTWQPQPVIP